MAPSSNPEEMMEAPDEAIDNVEADLQRQRMEQIRGVVAAPEPVLSEVAARGRDFLAQKLKEHRAKTEKKIEEYSPNPRTPAMLERLREEQEAGRRTTERHAAQQAHRPPPVKEKWDGTNTEVARPINMVPDPTKTPAHGFAGGDKPYSPDV